LIESIRDEAMSFKGKCELLNVPRGSMYYKPKNSKNNDQIIVAELHNIYNDNAFYGYRRKVIALRENGFIVNHKKVLRLQKVAGLRAIYPSKKTTIRNKENKVYPYLLRDLGIDRPNQVWQVDITYIRIRGGTVYLVCLIDVFSRKIMGWQLSISLDTTLCLEALEKATACYGVPEIINSDQGCQFTSALWTTTVKELGSEISMDGVGRWADNVHVERFWRTLKYEFVYLYSFDSIQHLRVTLRNYIEFYNKRRYHSKLNYHAPDAVYQKKYIPTKKELFLCFLQRQEAFINF
jgi:putative transposase